jgi:hypothetical protein
LEKFVSDAIEKALTEKYKSIAFPAIGCGKFGCSISLVAQAMIGEAQRTLQKHNLSILFVIQPERTDIYDEFQKQINMLQLPSSLSPTPELPQSLLIPQPAEPVIIIAVTVNKGTIEVEKGDITAQKVY